MSLDQHELTKVADLSLEWYRAGSPLTLERFADRGLRVDR